MHIVINQSNNVFGMDAENKIFAQSTETITFDVTFNDPQATLQGLYCALLSDGGKTLALTTIDGNRAVLDTNTIECVEYVAQWAIGTTRHAFLVIGESTKPLAIIDVEVAQNPLEGIMPPTESAPTYPTSAELQAILNEMTAQAKIANDSAQSANQSAILINNAKDEVVRIGAQVNTDKVLIKGYASTASSSASRAEEAKRIAVNASESVSGIQDEINATKTKIDATAKTVQSNADAVTSAKTAVETAKTQAETAKTQAETAKTDAVKAQGEAGKSAEQASTSADNAATSATNAKTAEANAKASATQAENATALKVDQRINTADNSEYPLIVMVDKDVYKFIAPKGATGKNDTRYCCDGTAHYFYGNGRFYEYDQTLKFVRSFKYNPGQHMGQNPAVMSVDFCTRIGDYFFLRYCAYPYTTQKLMKYDLDGNLVAELIQDRPNVVFRRICRNEQSGHLIIFDRFEDVADDGSTVYKMGYYVYDENLNLIRDTDRLDCDVPGSGKWWLYHFSIPSNVTLVTFAPTDATKTALYYLDKNDKIVEVDANVIRGKGAFTSADLTATGRTSANYEVPRIFYGILYRNQFHDIHVINNAKLYRILVYPNTENGVVIKKGTDSGLGGYGDLAIKATSVPNNRLTANSLVPANGGGSATGGSVVYQNYASIANAIVTKPFSYLNLITDFAPDPFANSASISVGSAGNTHPVFNNTAATNAYHLFPAGTYDAIGGAIMFTL